MKHKKPEKIEELSEAEQNSRALIQMYQAGFLDGYNAKSYYKHRFLKKIKKLCLDAFNKRFKEQLEGRIKEEK